MTKYQIVAVMLATSSAIAALPVDAAQILIVNGSSVTSEPDTTASITDRLSTLLTGVGNTVTVSDLVPTDLSFYGQVWDLRFSNASALTSSTISQYVGYLQSGGGMFVMGENVGFATRNSSVISLIDAAGGGSLNFSGVNSTQTVYDPFTGPNAVSNVTYAAPGGVDSFGTGQWITSNLDGSAGTGVAFGVGSLANASNGALTAIFDVNFLQTNASADNQALAANLVNFVGDEVDPPVPAIPEPATWAMLLFGFFGIGSMVRHKAKVRTTLSYG